MTEQLKEKNEAIEQQVVEIKDLNTALDAKNQSLVEFAYALSHDLKNPLSNIVMLSQIAKKKPDNSKFLEKIETSALIMDNIVKGLMQIIDLDQDASASVQALHFQPMVEMLSREYDQEIKDYQGTVQTDFEVESIYFIKPYLESIIRNLMSNAIKYHAEERPLHLRFSTHSTGGYTVLSVSDNGIGMDLSRHQNALFKPFKRFTDKNSGKGIGLYLIKKMIEKNRGEIRIESTPGEGTVFHCHLKPYN